MPLSFLPVVPPSPPSDAWIVCAACGPIRDLHAVQAGLELAGEPGVEKLPRRYAVGTPVPFPTLRARVAASQVVQQHLADIEAARCGGSGNGRRLSHEEIIGSARAALLLGRAGSFMQRYREYVQETPGSWHPDSRHFLFWDGVLGPGWAGGDAVPEGEARDELSLYASLAYAFFAPPPGTLCCPPAHEEWLLVAYALRAADARGLERLKRAGSVPAKAACEMIAGAFSRAHDAFASFLGRAEESRFPLVYQHGMPLLVHALICGILAGCGTRYLRAWFAMGRFALEQDFAPSQKNLQEQLSRFLDHLELVDSLINRHGFLAERLRFNGALSQLPFAMVYRSLPEYVRRCMMPDELAAAVVELDAAGLRLLARYGASGLLGADGLSHEKDACLRGVLGGDMTLPVPNLPRSPGEVVCEALADTVRRGLQTGDNPLLVADAQSPVLVASRLPTGALLDMRETEVLPPGQDIPPALRVLRKYAPNGLAVLEGATAVEMTRLFVALQAQANMVGSLALPGETLREAQPEPVMLLAHTQGATVYASLRLSLLPETSPLLIPGRGLSELVLEGAGGTAVPVRRDWERELLVFRQAIRRLEEAGLAEAECLQRESLCLRSFSALANVLKICRELGLACCWEAGHVLHLHQPTRGLCLRQGERVGEWLELGGGLPVDEGRVLELSDLLNAYARREGDTLCLGGGEYLLLTPALERQLALLDLVLQEKQGKRRVASAAIPLLDSQALCEAPAAALSPSLPEVPEGLQTTLRPYQLLGYHWLAERFRLGLGALLADDMGLGKTVQVLALLLHAAAQEGAGPSLVVAPLSLRGNWAEEAARFAPSLKVVIYDPSQPEALAEVEPGCLVLASYGQIVTRQTAFAACHWELLVLDEAQAIKNPESRRAQALCALKARARLCLTGTPIENSLLDLWSQMRFLNPGLLGARTHFLRRFRQLSPGELSLLRELLAPIVLRRTKADVLTQLPPLTETVVWVDFSREERALYESLRRRAVERLERGGEGASGGVSILADLTRLRRACCHGKLALAEFSGDSSKISAMVARVEELRAAGRRVLVFSQFTDVLDLAEESLVAAHISLLRLDGSTPVAQRNKAVHQFQNGMADAFLVSLKAGGAGLNLTAADDVILLDPWWNPAVEAQAVSRSHRMGQQRPVTLCRFMVRGTVEERILELHRDKRELAESVLFGSAEELPLSKLRALLG